MIVLIILIVLMALCINALKPKNRKPPLLDGALPIVGHTFTFIKNPEETLQLIFKAGMDAINLGGIGTARIVATDAFVISDPEDAYTFLNSCLEKHFFYDFMKPWLGEGLITGSESIWKRHRKLLNPAFNQAVMDGFLSEFNAQARHLVNTLEAEVGRGQFNHIPYIEHITLQTLCSTAMGVVNDETDIALRKEYLYAIRKFQDGLVVRGQSFWLHSDLIYSLSGRNKVQNHYAKKLHELTNAVIMKRKAKVSQKQDDKKGFKPFLDRLLDMEKNGALIEREVQEEVDTFTFAGSDTVSVALTVLLLAVGSYTDVQRKIVEELGEVFQGSDRDVEKQDLLQLKYLEAVVKETLRLYPPVPGVGRALDKNVTLKNYTLPSGSRCFVSLYGVNRHPSWGADAEQFRPERWLEPTSLPSQQLLAAFGFGKRRCIGINYALMSIKTVLVHVLRRYRVSGDITRLVQVMEVLVRPVHKDYISIERRVKMD